MKNYRTIIIGIFTILLIGAATANAATWTVTKSTDSNDNICDADCSLREAVFKAQSGDTVVFNSSLIGQTFTLGGSQMVINNQITIDGNLDGVNVAFISGSNTSRIFYLNTTNSALTLKNAILVQGNSSAVFADVNSSLTLDRVRIAGNSSNFGGAVTLRNGTHHITNTSFSGNTGTSCSAIELGNGGNLYMANVTVTNNHSGAGGGIVCNGGSNMFIRNSTIAYNDSDSSGAMFIFASGNVNIGNSIVAQNTGSVGADFDFVSGTITSVGGNLIGNLDTVPANTFNKPMDIFGVNPLLAPSNATLGGHPVFYHPLQAGSPARNGGVNANAVDPFDNTPLTTDARGTGFPRIA
ncbi:MAG TPA: right-handed parallel beta-helix repeat-containing protein, partial [Pyrinomonadaceae bacterium]|nr:right-handed parallel beta-helix repeat-containing protein [Pyrinomonadaceae bacterium]